MCVNMAHLDETYLVRFERVGRDHYVPPQTFTVRAAYAADDLASAIFRFVKPKLASRHFEVIVDLEKMHGSIEYGRFGEFRLEHVP